MHRLIGTFAVVAGAIIVVLAARHGYVSSGAPASGVVATIFALFAIGGLVGPAFAVYLWQRIQDRLPEGVSLHRVRIQEDPLLYAEYFGP